MTNNYIIDPTIYIKGRLSTGYMRCLFILVGMCSTTHLFAQRCATYEYVQQLKKRNPSLYENINAFQQQLTARVALRRAAQENILADEIIYRIPVVVHVMHNNINGLIGGAGNSNITNEQIWSQIEVLNEDFRRKSGTRGFNTNPVGADVKIEFCLADKTPNGLPSTGINRVYYGSDFYDYNSYDTETKMKAQSYWPSDQYLNLWVINIKDILGVTIPPPGTNLPGLETYPNTEPNTDGCVIHYEAFGRVGQVTQYAEYGHTATHEIGHWLGLLHIWGDSYCGEDYVSDTPKQAKNNNALAITCPKTYSTCDGVTREDMNANYMDFSPDVCMNVFTLQQKERMRTALTTSPRRAALIKSNISCFASVAVDNADDIDKVIQFYWKDNHLCFDTQQSVGAGNIYVYDVLGRLLWNSAAPEYSKNYQTTFSPTMEKAILIVHLQTSKGKLVRKISTP